MKKILCKIGSVVSILLMVLPFVIIYFYKDINIGYILLLLFISVCYIIYQYSVIKTFNKFDDFNKRFNDLKRRDNTMFKDVDIKTKYNSLIEFVDDYIKDIDDNKI